MSAQALINNTEKFNEVSTDIFNQFDKNKNGIICENELANARKTFADYKGVPVPDNDTIKRVFLSLDTNNDGGLSLDEFKEFIKKSLLNQAVV